MGKKGGLGAGSSLQIAKHVVAGLVLAGAGAGAVEGEARELVLHQDGVRVLDGREVLEPEPVRVQPRVVGEQAARQHKGHHDERRDRVRHLERGDGGGDAQAQTLRRVGQQRDGGGEDEELDHRQVELDHKVGYAALQHREEDLERELRHDLGHKVRRRDVHAASALADEDGPLALEHRHRLHQAPEHVVHADDEQRALPVLDAGLRAAHPKVEEADENAKHQRLPQTRPRRQRLARVVAPRAHGQQLAFIHVVVSF